MALAAIDDLDDALEATQAFLLPFSFRKWFKLAVVAFFLGGAGSGFTPGQYNFPAGNQGMSPGEFGPPDFGPRVIFLIAAIVIAVLLVVLILQFIGAIMEFIFIECLRRETVTLGQYWNARWRQGVRLFGFRLGLGIITLVGLAALGALILFPLLTGTANLSVALAIVVIPTAIGFLILSGVIGGFTTVFVVPIMVKHGGGVLAGWRQFWPTLKTEWKEYLVYLVIAFVLQIAAGILIGILSVIAGILLLIPFGIIGIGTFFLYTANHLAGIAFGGLVLLAFIIVLLLAIALIKVPVLAFLRYYALFLLGDTNAEFDLVADRRSAIRDEGTETG